RQHRLICKPQCRITEFKHKGMIAAACSTSYLHFHVVWVSYTIRTPYCIVLASDSGRGVMTYYSFGAWVRHRRKALDLTQVELARRAGCTEIMIQKLEADERRPSPALAAQLADHLQLAGAVRTTFLDAARGLRSATRLPTPASPLDMPGGGAPPGNLPA